MIQVQQTPTADCAKCGETVEGTELFKDMWSWSSESHYTVTVGWSYECECGNEWEER